MIVIVYSCSSPVLTTDIHQFSFPSQPEATRLATLIGQREPYVTVLFNNAGVLQGSFKRPTSTSASEYVSRFFDEISEEDFENVINTNAVGPYWMTFAFLPLLEKWKLEGSKKFVPQVIMTSSMNGWTKVSDIRTDNLI